MKKSQHYLVFRVGLEWYGLSVYVIDEILNMIALNEVPDSDVLGIITLRNQVIQVIDLRKQFGLEVARLTLDSPIIVLKTAQKTAGYVVDEIEDVIQVEQQNLMPYDDYRIENTFRYDDKLIMVLNPEALDNRSQMDS